MDQFATIADMVKEAEKHADDLSKDRIRAVEYYQGKMVDTPADKGRSAMVTRDVRSTIKKVLPSLMRTILGGDEVVEFQPVGQNDEEGAAQASDYVNFVAMQECDARRHIEDALHDALLLRNGILKWWFEEKRTAKVSSHTGLPDDALAQLVNDEAVEVLEHDEREEQTDMGPITVHDVKIRRIVTERNIRAAAVPRERFLIHPDAVTLEDSVLTGEKSSIRRSDLVAMGYDKDVIWALGDAEDDDYESDVRRDFIGEADETHRANGLVDYYDLFVRYDADGDGIAELHHMCFAGGLTEKNLLVDEEADEVQFADVKVMSQPHQWEGIALSDDMMDIQRVKTVLLRQTLDNLYWQNRPQPIMQDGVITNPEAVFNPEFGLPIRVRQGADVRGALGFNTVPFVARDSFGMMEYLDQEATDRTGVSDASAGLAPDALQNMTAKASAMIEQAGIGQTELMVRTAAEGLRRFFRGLLRLTIKHQDVPRTVRLRGKWVQFDPRQWNAEMDCTVNTGLGAGTRERDMMVMQQVIMLQEKLLASFGPDNPFVKPDQVYNALSKMVAAAGLKTVGMYFTEPDPEEVQAKMEAMKNAPSPDQIKAQAEQAKLQAQMQLEQAKIAANRDKEAAQMQADLQVKKAQAALDMQMQDKQLAWEREKFLLQQRVELTKLGLTQNDAGEPINAQADAMMSMMQQTQAMLAAVGQTMAHASKPKRVVRDETGEIVGLEPYDPMVN